MPDNSQQVGFAISGVTFQAKAIILEGYEALQLLLVQIHRRRFLEKQKSSNLILFLDEENFSYSNACEAFEGDEESCRNCRILHVLNDCLIDRRCVCNILSHYLVYVNKDFVFVFVRCVIIVNAENCPNEYTTFSTPII